MNTGMFLKKEIDVTILQKELWHLLISEPISFLNSSKASCRGGGVLGRTDSSFSGPPVELLGVPASSRSSFFSAEGVIELLLSGKPFALVTGLVTLGAGLQR